MNQSILAWVKVGLRVPSILQTCLIPGTPQQDTVEEDPSPLIPKCTIGNMALCYPSPVSGGKRDCGDNDCPKLLVTSTACPGSGQKSTERKRELLHRGGPV